MTTSQHDWDLILQVQERMRVVEKNLGRPLIDRERAIYEDGFKRPFFQQLPTDEFQTLCDLLTTEALWSDFFDSLVNYSEPEETDPEKIYYQFVQYGIFMDRETAENRALEAAWTYKEITTAADLEAARQESRELADYYEKWQRVATELLGEDW